MLNIKIIAFNFFKTKKKSEMKQNKLTLTINKLPPLMKRESRSHDEKRQIGQIIKDLNLLLPPDKRGQSNNRRNSL